MGINNDIKPIKNAHRGIKLNDDIFRWLMIPFFGIAIPVITGMVDHSSMNVWMIKLSYLYTIGIAFVIYQGNRYLIFTLRSYFNWYNKPIRKILALLLVIPFFTIPASVLMLVGWYMLFNNGLINRGTISTATLIILICVIFVVHVYETAFLVAESESEMVKNAQLQQAKAEAELQALKSQIDPHFIFNSLNTLSHLIVKDSGKALQFNDNLAEVYRYILQNKKTDLVLLRDEMQFVLTYYSLLKIRFGDALRLQNNIPESLWDIYLVPSISIQLLLENAIKHNDFSNTDPICINLSITGESLEVSNETHIKKLRKASSRIGLQNLNDRYQMLTNKAIVVVQDEELFTVRLPLLRVA